MKVVIDTNVLVSGLLNPRGVPGRILAMLLKGDIEIIIDDRILAEYRRVLNYPKFPFQAGQINTLLEFISCTGIHVNSTPLRKQLPDISDQPFLEAARAARSDALITGNLRDFPGVKEALSPREFLERWQLGRKG